jgi:hypothetical protein
MLKILWRRILSLFESADQQLERLRAERDELIPEIERRRAHLPEIDQRIDSMRIFKRPEKDIFWEEDILGNETYWIENAQCRVHKINGLIRQLSAKKTPLKLV